MHSKTAYSIVPSFASRIRRSPRLVPIATLVASVVAFDVTAYAAGAKYQLTILQSDGTTTAPNTDANLVNPWGLAASPTGPWWIADNHSSVSTVADSTGASVPIVVSIPGAGGPGAPTGLVFNSTTDFSITDGVTTAAATFIFASEDGTITGWNTGVPAPGPSTVAEIAVDNSASGAIYKGLALVTSGQGSFLYATDFHNARVDVFDSSFAPVTTLPSNAFTDPQLPPGYAPFGIQAIDGNIFVTYTKLEAGSDDEKAGQGLGVVDVYDASGGFLSRVATRGLLNAPWGVALAPPGFGKYGNSLLVGNFGDGSIIAFDSKNFTPQGPLRGQDGHVIHIDGLWGIAFGNDRNNQPSTTLFFAAGPDDEQHGLYGRLDPPSP